MNLSATAAPTEICSKQLSHTDEAWNFFSHSCDGVPLSYFAESSEPMSSAPWKRFGWEEGEQLVPCTSSRSVLTLVLRRHMLGCVQADCSQLTHILEQRGIRKSSGGLPSFSLLTMLLESQHKPAGEWATQDFFYPNRRLKGSSVADFGLWQIHLIFACLPIVPQICKQYCVFHTCSNLSQYTSWEIFGRLYECWEVCQSISIDSAQGCCTKGCAVYSSKDLLMRIHESKERQYSWVSHSSLFHNW